MTKFEKITFGEREKSVVNQWTIYVCGIDVF